MPTALKLNVLSSALKAANNASTDYKDAMAILMNYSASLKGYSLPNLSHSDNWPGGKDAYAQTQEQWAKVTGNLRGWALSVLGQLTTLPVFMIDSSRLTIVPMLNGALDDVDHLLRKPDDKGVKEDLLYTLRFLDRKYGEYSKMTDTLIQSLEEQRSQFEEDAALMRQIADAASKTGGVDHQKIAELRNDIKRLNDDITTRAIAIAGGSLATIASVAMGGVSLALAIPTFGVSLFLLVPALLIGAGGVYIIATNAIEIEKDKAEIAKKSQTMSELEADILLLQVMSDTLTGFANQVAAMKESIGIILAPWQATADYFHSAIPTIEGIVNATSEDWQSVKTELQVVRDGWEREMLRMEDIKLESTIHPDANLEIGMDEQQVGQAMENSKSVDIVQYLAA